MSNDIPNKYYQVGPENISNLIGVLSKNKEEYEFENCYIAIGTRIDNGKLIGPFTLYKMVDETIEDKDYFISLNENLRMRRTDLMDSELYDDILTGKELLLGDIFQVSYASKPIEMEQIRSKFTFAEKIFNALSSVFHLNFNSNGVIKYTLEGSFYATWDAQDRCFRSSDNNFLKEIASNLIHHYFVAEVIHDSVRKTLFVKETVTEEPINDEKSQPLIPDRFVTISTNLKLTTTIGPVNLYHNDNITEPEEFRVKLNDHFYIKYSDLMNSDLYTDIVFGGDLTLVQISKTNVLIPPFIEKPIEMEQIRSKFTFTEKVFTALACKFHFDIETGKVRKFAPISRTATYHKNENRFSSDSNEFLHEIETALMGLPFIGKTTHDLKARKLDITEKKV